MERMKKSYEIPRECFAGTKPDGEPVMVTSRCPHCKESVMWLPIEDGSPSGSAVCLSAIGVKKNADGKWMALAHGDTCKNNKRPGHKGREAENDPFWD